MAFLLRQRSIPSLSLLHHHRHLSSTTTSVSYVLCKTQFRVLTFTTPSPSLLPHHRLLATSNSGDHPNSNHPSPTSIRELREAIQHLSASDYIVHSKTPTYTTFSFVPSSNSNVVPDSSAAADFVATGKLDEKLQRLKLSVLNLGQRKTTDRNHLWKLKESRNALREDILKNVAESISRVQEHKGSALSPETCEMMVKEIDGLIAELTRLVDMTAEAAELLGVLTDSRLASLEEIVKNLSEIRDELQHEVWDELNQGLVKGRETELKEANLLAVEMKQQVKFLFEKIQNLHKIRGSYSYYH